jgi:Putative zinc-binding metallo-peptidase
MAGRSKKNKTSVLRPRRKRRRPGPRWVDFADEDLLDLRFCDLRLSLRFSPILPRIVKLDSEIARRGIAFRPHFWLAEEWFSPDGIPGIAIPFYLAHPRLMRLERHFMQEVEGGNENWQMRILRHETGHAIDTAFRLRRRKDWRITFGMASQPYPDAYRPRPASRDFVLHLGHWYAQSHPTEDFAETFAVWLQPRARWQRDYADWPALAKLEYVDALMHELRGRRALLRNRDVVEPLASNQRTLREHYRRKISRYELSETNAYDERLKRVFRMRRRYPSRRSAAGFLRQVRPQLTRLLIRRSRLHPYLVHHVARTVIHRCRELDLVVAGSQRDAKREALRLHERILLDLLRSHRERYAL